MTARLPGPTLSDSQLCGPAPQPWEADELSIFCSWQWSFCPSSGLPGSSCRRPAVPPSTAKTDSRVDLLPKDASRHSTFRQSTRVAQRHQEQANVSRWEHLEASTPYRVGRHLPPVQSHPSRPEYRESIKSFSIKSPTLSIKKKITSSTNDVNDLSQSQINKAKFKPKQDYLVYFLGRCWIGCSGNGVNHTDRTTAKAEKALEGLRTTDLCVE